MKDPTPPPGYVYFKSVDQTEITDSLQKWENALQGVPNAYGKTPIFVQEWEFIQRMPQPNTLSR